MKSNTTNTILAIATAVISNGDVTFNGSWWLANSICCTSRLSHKQQRHSAIGNPLRNLTYEDKMVAFGSFVNQFQLVAFNYFESCNFSEVEQEQILIRHESILFAIILRLHFRGAQGNVPHSSDCILASVLITPSRTSVAAKIWGEHAGHEPQRGVSLRPFCC